MTATTNIVSPDECATWRVRHDAGATPKQIAYETDFARATVYKHLSEECSHGDSAIRRQIRNEHVRHAVAHQLDKNVGDVIFVTTRRLKTYENLPYSDTQIGAALGQVADDPPAGIRIDLDNPNSNSTVNRYHVHREEGE